jgi:ABC-type multidrug transport system fused ATPase/permease subunit
MKKMNQKATSPDVTPVVKLASLQGTFANADSLDISCMIVGTFAALLTGASLPAFVILLGQMYDDLNNGSSIEKAVNETCIIFVVVGGINLVSGFVQVMAWSYAGERQSERFKTQYVQAILSQEVGWFDTCNAGELSTRVADLGGKLQDGLTRHVSDVVQHLFEILISYAAAFYLCWQLTLVLLASFPLIAMAGNFMIQAVAAAQNESTGQYAAAGGLATEMLGAIRTVTALNDQPSGIAKYRAFILEAMEVGILKSFKIGLGSGLTFFISSGTYALGFW